MNENEAESFSVLLSKVHSYVERFYELDLGHLELIEKEIVRRIKEHEKPMSISEVEACCDVILEDLPDCVIGELAKV